MPKPLKSAGDYNKYTCYSWSEFWESEGSKYKMKRTVATKVIERFGKRIHDLILDNPEGVQFNFGTLMMAGAQGDFKNPAKSTLDNIVDYRNVKTDKVVYTVRYIYGKGRGKLFTGILWKFRTTVPLRQRIKKMIEEGNFRHWFIFKSFKDVPRFGINSEIITRTEIRKLKHKQKLNDSSGSNSQTQELNKGS